MDINDLRVCLARSHAETFIRLLNVNREPLSIKHQTPDVIIFVENPNMDRQNKTVLRGRESGVEYNTTQYDTEGCSKTEQCNVILPC